VLKQFNHFSWEEGYSTEYNYAFSLAEQPDGLLFTCSAFHGFDGHHLVKVDYKLKKKWEKKLIGFDVIDPSSIAVDRQANIYVAGPLDRSGLSIQKYDDQGNLEWENKTENDRLYRVGQLLPIRGNKILFSGYSHHSGLRDWQGEYFVVEP